jgi:hypothetical protein
MRDAHTCTIGGVDMIMPSVGLPHVEPIVFTSEMIHGSCVQVPCRINSRKSRTSLGGHGNLTRRVGAIIAKTQELTIKMLVIA